MFKIGDKVAVKPEYVVVSFNKGVGIVTNTRRAFGEVLVRWEGEVKGKYQTSWYDESQLFLANTADIVAERIKVIHSRQKKPYLTKEHTA